MTIEQIKQAVDDGQTVHVGNLAYVVIKSKFGEYMIKCTLNDHCIGLHGREGTKYANRLNGENFFMIPIKRKEQIMKTEY